MAKKGTRVSTVEDAQYYWGKYTQAIDRGDKITSLLYFDCWYEACEAMLAGFKTGDNPPVASLPWNSRDSFPITKDSA